MSEEYRELDTGLGTTPEMWLMVSELLDGEKIPKACSEAIISLCKGEASVVDSRVVERVK